MKLKKFMLSALILVFAVGCVNHSGQSASGLDETYYPSVYDELLELDRIDRVEGFILGRDPDYDEKKIFTEPDEVKQFIDVLTSMSIKSKVDDGEWGPGGSSSYEFYADDELLLSLSFIDVSSKTILIETADTQNAAYTVKYDSQISLYDLYEASVSPAVLIDIKGSPVEE